MEGSTCWDFTDINKSKLGSRSHTHSIKLLGKLVKGILNGGQRLTYPVLLIAWFQSVLALKIGVDRTSQDTWHSQSKWFKKIMHHMKVAVVVAVLLWALNFLKIIQLMTTTSIGDTSWLTKEFCKGTIQTISLPLTRVVAVTTTKVASATPAFVSTVRTQSSMISARAWMTTALLLVAQSKARSLWKTGNLRKSHLMCKALLPKMSTYQSCSKRLCKTQMWWNSLSLLSVQMKESRHKEIKSKFPTVAISATLVLEQTSIW